MRKQRRQSGGGSSASRLSHQIRSLNLPSAILADDDAVAQHLRSSFPHYSRLPQRAFSLNVRQALHLITAVHSPSNPPAADADSDDDGDLISSSSARSRKKSCRSEERLLDAEEAHLRNYRKNNANSNSSDGSISTSESEDAIFEVKFDPEFDLTKSMLRANYGKQIQKQKQIETAKPKRKVEEDVMEIDTANEKKRVKMGRTTKGGVSSEGVEDKRKWEDGLEGEMGKKGPKFNDLGGMKGVIEELMMEVIVPLCHPQLPRWLGVKPMAGILFHGPPGCGKTMLARAIATETKVPFYMISATEVVSGVSGASEESIRDLFSKAYRTAPSIVFIDEIDAIASKRENLQREMERRIVTQLMTCMDESHQILKSSDADSESETSEKKPGYVLVIGATNRPDAVDQALRRPGRFDREIALGVPDENARLEILSVLTKSLRLEGEFNLMKIARATPGYVGADLQALVDKAGNLAMKRVIDRRRSKLEGQMIDDWWRQSWTPEEVEGLYITMTDFEEATKMVQPSSRREGFSSIPNTKWEDVGGLNSLRKEFERYIVQRIKNPEDYEELGVNLEVGFLLYGPPGCGKTLIAKAVANEAGANFIHIKGPEILNKYVGESELAVRTIFTRARTCAPCILFFDEVDALTTTRDQDGGLVDKRLVNQLLVELDGAGRQGVYVIGATNRLEVMDPAFVRPGRFGKVLYVPLPSAEERGLILKTLARNKPVAADVDLDAFGRRAACQNLTGADLSAVINEAAMAVLEEKQVALEESGSSIIKPLVIETSHFEIALKKIKPSVSEKQRIYYENLSKSYGAS